MISIPSFFYPLLLFGFLIIPKVSLGFLSFYISELVIFLLFLIICYKNKGSFLFENKHFFPFKLLFFWLSFSFFIVLVSSVNNITLETMEPFILIAKSFLYFFIFTLICSHTSFPAFVNKHLKKLFLIFFISSFVLTLWKVVSSGISLSTLLWSNQELGARFVGFTGFAFSSEGLINLGSTSNSVGMFYLLFTSIFLYGPKHLRSITLGMLSVAGAVLTFSQSAVLGIALLFLFQFIRSKIPLYILFIFVFIVFTIVYLYLYFPQIFSNLGVSRILNSLIFFASSGQLPGTLGDRVIQMSHIFSSFNEYPGSIFIGQPFFWDHGLKNVISEGFLLYQFKTFGIIGLLLGLLFQINFFKAALKIKYNPVPKEFFIIFFLINIFLNNSFQTDFLLMILIPLIFFPKAIKNEV